MNRILRILAVLLSSSLVSIAAGVVRQKLLALEVGPEGIGQLGLLVALSGTVATLGGLGLATSGVQRVSVTREDDEAASAQRGLLLGSSVLALAAGVLTAVLAPWFGLSPTGPDRWVTGLAVALTIASAGQVALLNGLGLVRQIAWITGVSAVAGTALTAVALLAAPQWGIATALLAPLAMTFGLGWWFRQGQGAQGRGVPWRKLGPQVRQMLSLGAVVAVGTGIGLLGQYVARWYIQREFGAASLGQYQAAWSVTMLYLGVLLSAMSIEFFPRISRMVETGAVGEISTAVGQQIQLVLGLSLPVICLFMLFSDQVMLLLFTPAFADAAPIARQQFLGDVFKLAAWAIAYTLLARNAKLIMFLSELVWITVYLLLLTLFRQRLGFEGVGWAYAGAYAAYFVFCVLAYRRQMGQALSSRAGWVVAGSAGLAGLHLLAYPSPALRLVLASADVALLGVAAWWFWQRRRRMPVAT